MFEMGRQIIWKDECRAEYAMPKSRKKTENWFRKKTLKVEISKMLQVFLISTEKNKDEERSKIMGSIR